MSGLSANSHTITSSKATLNFHPGSGWFILVHGVFDAGAHLMYF